MGRLALAALFGCWSVASVAAAQTDAGTAGSRAACAQAAFAAAEELRIPFERVRVSAGPDVDEILKTVREELQEATRIVAAYDAVVRCGDPHATLDALAAQASVYDHYYRSVTTVLGSATPATLAPIECLVITRELMVFRASRMGSTRSTLVDQASERLRGRDPARIAQCVEAHRRDDSTYGSFIPGELERLP